MESKWSVFIDEINVILRENNKLSSTEIAKKLLETNDSVRQNKDLDTLRTFVDRYRKRKKEKFHTENTPFTSNCKSLDDTTNTSETTTSTNQYKGKQFFTAVSRAGGIMDIKEYCIHYGFSYENVRSYKLVTHTGIPYYNIAFYETFEEKIENLDFEKIFKNKIEPFNTISTPKFKGRALFDRLVYTDTHIGMDPNPDGFSLYGGVWNEEEIMFRNETMCQYIIEHQDSNILHIDDLGDFMDGLDGKTVRREHDLPQNMDNQKAFDVGFRFKIKMIESLIKHYDTIICNNVCEDNHSGAFGYVVNQSFKYYIEAKYPNNVTVNNNRKFIDHYEATPYYTFILSHGKDSKNLKFGFKPVLDDVQENKINSYIDDNYLYRENVTIEFSKGDSHRYLFDPSASDRFNYYNYPAFSPSSNWVQTNYKKGKSGFVMFNYYKDHKTINEYFFKWKKQ